MNILHLINYTGGGGTENYIYSLIEKVDRENILVAYNEKGDGYQKFENLGINMIQMDMKSFHDIKASKKLKYICSEYKIDIVHTHFLRENFIALISKFLGNKVKVINTRHMLDKNHGLIKYINRFMTRFNHKIIAVSQAVERLLFEEISSKNIEMIYTGVDLDKFKKSKGTALKDQYNLDKNTLLITSIARFSKEKGHDFLLEGIAAFKETLDLENIDLDYKFLLVGNGPEYEKIIEKSKELAVYDNIIFTGYRDDIVNILNSSDIFLSLSKMEAFGISILEAMAMDLAVISTDSGGPREIFQLASEEAGLLIDYGDVESLCKNLKDLSLDIDLRNKLAKNGYKTVLENFDLKDTVARTYEVYKF